MGLKFKRNYSYVLKRSFKIMTRMLNPKMKNKNEGAKRNFSEMNKL